VVVIHEADGLTEDRLARRHAHFAGVSPSAPAAVISRVLPCAMRNALATWLALLVGLTLLPLAACVHLSDRGEVVWGNDDTKSANPTKATPGNTPEGAPSAGPPTPSKGTTLRLTGSTTVGRELAPKLAAAYLRHLGAQRIDTSEEKDKHETVVSGTTGAGRLDIVIVTPGSKAAFEALERGECDVGMSSRPISSDETTRLSALGDMTSEAAEHVIALDGVAVVVHKSNPLSELSLEQVADLFSGKANQWAAVGGAARDVHVVTRDARSGTFEAFNATVMAGHELTKKARVFSEGAEVADAVASDPDAIGFVSLSQVGQAKPIALRDGHAAAELPSAFSIATEDYPVSRRLFLYVPPRTAHPHAKEIVAFATSAQGQAVVQDTGFVSLEVRAESRTASREWPPSYRHTIEAAQRLAVDFRFQTASTKLDAKARADLDRVAAFAKAEGKRKILLFGFTDAEGDTSKNVALSKERAQTVADALVARGAAVSIVEGFGSAMPIATNDSEGGRQRNRRVEAWLR
jgi:phosphate transport system substrate-binding protein